MKRAGFTPAGGRVLDALCPMHALIDSTGHIRHAGPTLDKVRPGGQLAGQRFLEVFELRRPRIVGTMASLRDAAGTKLHLRLRARPHTALKGLLVPLPDDASLGPPGGAVINLSFGISVVDAVRDFALTSADFAATDLTVEMLYLVEAKSAAMDASRRLNLRLQGAMIAAEEQAFTDTLTGVKNRRAMDHVLRRLAAAGTPFALMQLDLDFFKAVNDRLGHAAGDHVLQRAARVMVDETRACDTVVRAGGDEFVLILDGLTDTDRLSGMADRLIAELERPVRFDGQDCRISASIGIARSIDLVSPDPEAVMHAADMALYAAKGAGRGRHRLFVAGTTPPAAPR
jgi:diguanylate cyclase (GGDEF)-like protein